MFGSDSDSSVIVPETAPRNINSMNNTVDKFLAETREPLPRDSVNLNLSGSAPTEIAAQKTNTPIDLAVLVADLGEPDHFQHGLASDTETASRGETEVAATSVVPIGPTVTGTNMVRTITPPASPPLAPAVQANRRNRR